MLSNNSLVFGAYYTRILPEALIIKSEDNWNWVGI